MEQKMENKMKFNIYQIYNGCPMAMHMKHRMNFSNNIGFDAESAFAFNYYTYVANIKATDLDDVFEIGNIGQRSEIEIMEETKMHSISVGDIIENNTTKEKFVVASFGFEEISLEGWV